MLVLLLLVLVPVGAAMAAPDDDKKTTICHRTESETNPYDTITMSNSALETHADHQHDIIPAPPGGCPSTAQMPAGAIGAVLLTGVAALGFVVLQRRRTPAAGA